MTDSNPPDDDPFAEFEDWLIDGPAGEWPEPGGALSAAQQQIVKRNAALLADHVAWKAKVETFVDLISKLGIRNGQKRRQLYEIRFDKWEIRQNTSSFASRLFPCAVSFQETKFRLGTVQFDAALFYGTACFDGADFGTANVSFDGARCEIGTLSFVATTFGSGQTSFRLTRFGEGDLSFFKANFRDGLTTFQGARFKKGSKNFSEAKFNQGPVSFEEAVFDDGDVIFEQTTFGSGNVSFNRATFGDGIVNLEQAKFGRGNLSFNRATFGNGDISFEKATFGNGDISIEQATFGSGNINFDRVMFGDGDVSFEKSVFGDGDICFDHATFGNGNVNFEGARLIACKLWFVGLHVYGNLDCTSLKAQRATFRNTTVDGLADWTDAEFRSIPDFRQMKLDRAPEVARMTVPPPKMTGWWPLSVAKDQQDVLKFRKLKAMAIDANDHEKDGEFFAYEMLAKRGWETKGSIGLTANWLYWVLSSYGRSYVVPLCWMALSFVGFAAYYAWSLQRYVAMPDAAHFSFLFSIKNSIPFLGSLFRFAPVPKGYESRFDTIYQAASGAGLNVDALVSTGVTQSLVGGVFFFFLLLGLRNKFRLK